MDIRKISMGSDYKSGAMHYMWVILNDSHSIHLIQQDKDTGSKGLIERQDSVLKD